MAAYLIARVEVTDWTRYSEYTKRTPDVIKKFGGRFIVRGGEIVTFEGRKENRRLVVIEFPDLSTAKAFYESEEYSKVRKFREGAAVGEFLAVDGYAS